LAALAWPAAACAATAAVAFTVAAFTAAASAALSAALALDAAAALAPPNSRDRKPGFATCPRVLIARQTYHEWG